MSSEADWLARYGALASALAGCDLTLSLVEERAALTYTDGYCIYVPSERLSEAWLDVSLQALLLRNGALAPHALRRLYARPERARVYLAYELARAVSRHGYLLPRRVCEHDAVRALPQAQQDLELSLARARREGRAARDTPAAWGVLLPGRVLRSQPQGASSEAQEAAEAERVVTRPDEEALEESRVLDRFRAPFEGSVGLLGKLMAKLLDLRPSPNESAQAGARGGELEVSSASVPSAKRRVVRSAPRSTSGADVCEAQAPGVRLYPEWDARRRRYRREWVHVAEVEPHPDNAPEEQALPGRSGARTLQKLLRRLCLGYEPHNHRLEGDDLRIDALVRMRVALRSGQAGDERIYRAALRTRRDLGVLVLLDITGSSGERAADGVSVFERQLALALSLTQALHDAGDRVACYGFHSWGRKLVRLQRLLAFGERADARLFRRASFVSPVGYSRLGAAVRHATTILRRDAGTPYRLLVVISDGVAYDQGYEGDYARADTRRALREANAEATACVCLSVGADMEAEQQVQIFGGSHYLALPKLAGHERQLITLLERAVAGVSRRRPR